MRTMALRRRETINFKTLTRIPLVFVSCICKNSELKKKFKKVIHATAAADKPGCENYDMLRFAGRDERKRFNTISS